MNEPTAKDGPCLGCGHSKAHHVKGIGLCLVASCGLCLIYRQANEPTWQLLREEDLKPSA